MVDKDLFEEGLGAKMMLLTRKHLFFYSCASNKHLQLLDLVRLKTRNGSKTGVK